MFDAQIVFTLRDVLLFLAGVGATVGTLIGLRRLGLLGAAAIWPYPPVAPERSDDRGGFWSMLLWLLLLLLIGWWLLT